MEQETSEMDNDNQNGNPADRRPATQVLRGNVSRGRLAFILAGIMLGMLLGALDQTIVGTAMPRVIAELNGLEHYAWTFTGYMLAATATLPIWGKLSDLYGRKPFYLLGMAIFMLGSALSGMSQNMTQLIVFRGIQGLGAGAMLPIVQAIVGDIFPPAERGKWQGIMMAVFGLASIVGPTAGGWITDNWGWRWVFYVNMPVGVLAVVACALALPSFQPHTRHQIDYAGAATLIAGAVPLLLAFSWAGTQYAWSSPAIVGLLVFSLAMFVVFFVLESRAAEPIIAPALFRNRIFAVSVIVSFMVSAGMFGAIMYIPLFVQGVLGTSATASGAVLTPLMLGFMVSSIVGGQILSRTGRYRTIALASLATTALGMYLLSRLGVGESNSVVVRDMIVTGLGMGVQMSLFTIVVQNAFPFSQMGVVTSSLQFFRSIGGAIGVAIFGTLLTNGFHATLAQGMPPALQQALPAGRLAALENPEVLLAPQAIAQLKQTFAALGPQGPALAEQLLQAVRAALAVAITDVFRTALVLILIAFAAVLFLREIPLRSSHHEPAPEPSPSPARTSANMWKRLLR